MDMIVKMLQGPYAYLLIFQILIVTGLALTTLWLLVKRMRLSAAGGPEAVAVPGGDPELQAKYTQLEVEASRLREIESKWNALGDFDIEKLKADSARLKGIDQEVAGYKQKIEFLEKKLLEYEILQEEIGSLSALKAENESLKAQLFGGKPPLTAVAPPPSAASEAVAAANAVASQAAPEAPPIDDIMKQIEEIAGGKK